MMKYAIVNNTKFNQLEIEIEYDKGADSICGRPRPRGYYMTVTPYLYEVHDDFTPRYTVRTSESGSGLIICFEHAARLNKKRLTSYQSSDYIKQLIKLYRIDAWAIQHGYNVEWETV